MYLCRILRADLAWVVEKDRDGAEASATSGDSSTVCRCLLLNAALLASLVGTSFVGEQRKKRVPEDRRNMGLI